MSDAQWAGLFLVVLLLALPASLLVTVLRHRLGHGSSPVEHATDRVGFETLVDLERNRSANRS